MAAKTDKYIDGLTENGDISFTLDNLCQTLAISRSAGLSALSRLARQHKIVSPSKGYYLILTPDFRRQGCLPADFFIDDLMKQLNRDYYISLLSAAHYYGAAHQQTQMLQVMLINKRKNLRCANVAIEFIKNSQLYNTPLKKIKTRTGYINVSTPEGTARDLIRYLRQSGGLSRVTTVIDELAESIDPIALMHLVNTSKEYAWVHRLGFICEKLGKSTLAETLYLTINHHSKTLIPLVPYAPTTHVASDKKWQIAINANVASDLHDPH